LGVPLLFQARVNRILTLTHAQPHRFDENDLDLVLNIAGQAAIAIENACLFDHVRQERATLHAVISGLTEGIFITDTDGQVLYVNPAGAAALGVNAVAARGQALKDVVPDQRLSELLHTLLNSDEPQRGEICNGDGRAFDVSLVLLPSAGVVMTLHDVTHFKELDTLKSEFVTTVSHDLKSPLGLIYGYAWILAELPSLDAEARGHVRIIIDEVQKMQQMINSLLDLTMIESGLDQIQEPVDLVGLVKKGLTAFQVQAQAKDLELIVQAEPALPQIQGHSVRLGQAINNLISNAVKFSSPGRRIKVLVDLDGDEVCVRVSDEGPGIPAAKQAGLFQKFYKVGARETWSKEGHGLGLAIVRSVAEAHGGRVEVASVAGQGATFSIILPLASAVDASDSAARTRLAVP
jgi:PAS domain S-box-containing protein